MAVDIVPVGFGGGAGENRGRGDPRRVVDVVLAAEVGGRNRGEQPAIVNGLPVPALRHRDGDLAAAAGAAAVRGDEVDVVDPAVVVAGAFAANGGGHGIDPGTVIDEVAVAGGIQPFILEDALDRDGERVAVRVADPANVNGCQFMVDRPEGRGGSNGMAAVRSKV